MEIVERAIRPPSSDTPAGAGREKIGLVGVDLPGTALAEQLPAGRFDVVGFDPDSACMDQLRTLGGEAAGSAMGVFWGA